MRGMRGTLTFLLFSVSFSFNVYAGDFVFGPVKVEVGPDGKGEKTFEFEIRNTRATYGVHVRNGYMLYEGKGEKVKKGEIYINGKLVMTFDDKPSGPRYRKKSSVDVKLKSKNVMVVKVWGPPGSFASINIIEAPLNRPVCNEDCSLMVQNYGSTYGVNIYWSRYEEEGVEYYVFYRSESEEGPWERLFEVNWRYRTGPVIDRPPDLDKKTYCYKIEAVRGGRIIKVLGPVCVPPRRSTW